MRPRSRLVSKRRLTLPTIREGAEETVRDLNEANTLLLADHSQAVSSEDYLLSICHLARPTFPDGFSTQHQSAVQHRLRPSQLIRTTLNTFEFTLKDRPQASCVLQGETKGPNEELLYGNPDPLEYLYGHPDNSSVAEGRFARQNGSVWQSRVRTRASSVPNASNNISVLNVSPEHCFSGSEVMERVCPADGGADGGERLNQILKHPLISRWIADCRSAWREARLKACVLPAIAEV